MVLYLISSVLHTPLVFPHFPHQWLHDEPLEEGLHVIVEAHEAAAEQQTHVPAHVREEAVGVVDDILEAIV